jgi:hypothetical protein
VRITRVGFGLGSRTDGFAFATTIIRRVCEIAGPDDLIEDLRVAFEEEGLIEAVRHHDDDAIFQWLAEAISYQGVSDEAARTFIARHGRVSASDIQAGLDRAGICPKLISY